MLQQTTVAAVVPRYTAWMKRFPNIMALAGAAEQDVLQAWQGLGYYSRARRLSMIARAIVSEREGHWPETAAGLAALPGIGPYTSAAIASFAFGEPVAVVDANVVRVVTRLCNIREPVDTARGKALVAAAALKMFDADHPARHNNAMMELGATVCLPNGPKCSDCPVAAQCASAGRAPESLPVKKPRARPTALVERHVFVHGRRGILLRRQPGSRWHGLWTLPEADLKGLPVLADAQPLHCHTFPITRYRVTLQVYAARTPRRLPDACAWWALNALDACPMPSPHRRVLRNLLSRFAHRLLDSPASLRKTAVA